MFKTAFAVVTKAMVVTNHQFFCADSFYDNLLNEFFRRELREFFGKRNADQVTDTLFFQQVGFFFKCIEQLERIVFRMKHQAGIIDHVNPAR